MFHVKWAGLQNLSLAHITTSTTLYPRLPLQVPAAGCYCPLSHTTLYCLTTLAYTCQQVAQSAQNCYKKQNGQQFNVHLFNDKPRC